MKDEIHLLQEAREIVEDRLHNSQLFDNISDASIPRFDASELLIGKKLGVGAFCTVSEIQKVVLKDKTIPEVQSDILEYDKDDFDQPFLLQNREFIAARYFREGKHARYAIKKLSDDISPTDDPDRFVSAISDLATEVLFLSVINHSHIIKLRAISANDRYSLDYFLVLDRLYDTLGQRIPTWRKKEKQISGPNKIFDFSGKRKKKSLTDRLLVACDLCSALNHLHKMNVIYRDLKPQNVGFDVRGDVKLFDFGLSREIDLSSKLEGNLYHLSCAGSLRYMAPEMAKYEPYNENVDVYAFSILLWEICFLETPFLGFSTLRHKREVILGGKRPIIKQNWNPNLEILMSSCWSETISDRPSFKEVIIALRNEIGLRSNGESFRNPLDTSSRTDKTNESNDKYLLQRTI